MVDDVEVGTDQVNDPSTRPQAGTIAGRFRPGDHQTSQSVPLGRGQLRGSTGGRPGAQAGAALSPVGALPSPDGPPIDAQALGHHMDGQVTLEQFDRAESSSLELGRAPLWAHVHLPQAVIAA
jgi:hypothetical protein